MKTLATIAKILLANQSKKPSRKQADYLLSAIALSALSDQVLAQEGVKTFKVDVADLAARVNAEIIDITKVEVRLADPAKGTITDLGGGVFEITLAEGVDADSVSLSIAGSGVAARIDIAELAAEAGVAVKDLGEVEVTLADPAQGKIVVLGDGSFGVIYAHAGADDTALVVAGAGVDKAFTTSMPGASVSLAETGLTDWSILPEMQITASAEMAGLGLGILAAAAGGGSAAAAAAVVGVSDLGGFISHGTLSNAQVYLDADSDGVLDWVDANDNDQWDEGEGEQWTLSGNDGSYSLTGLSNADIASGTLVGQAYIVNGASQTVDAISGSGVENLVMKADASATVITPLTTLVNAGVDKGKVLEVLGLSEEQATLIGDVNSYNPFAADIADEGTAEAKAAAVAFEKVASQVFTMVNTIATAVGSAAGDDVAAKDVFTSAIQKLAAKVDEAASAGDAGGQVDLTDTTIVKEIAVATATAVDTQSGPSDVSVTEVFADLSDTIAKAVSNINTSISAADSSDISAFGNSAKDVLNVGAEALAEQVKASVEKKVIEKEIEVLEAVIASGTAEEKAAAEAAKAAKDAELAAKGEVKITLAADKLVTVNEDSSDADRTFEVAEGTVDDGVGEYGVLSNAGGKNWIYTLDTTNDKGQWLNAQQTYTETFVITETDGNTTHEVTVVLNGSNDAAAIDGTTTGAVTEDSTTTTASGQLTHTDVDANNADNTFTAITTATASTKGYGTYTVTEGGAWTYTLDNTNATVDALGEGQSTTDTITVTAEDGTEQLVTITITGANDAAVITADGGTVAEGNTVVEGQNVVSDENVFQINSAQVVLNDFDPATQADIHRVVSLDSAGGVITVDGSTSLNLTNLLNAANNSGDFEAPTVSFELAKVPTGTGSGTIGIDILDGSDATRTEGSERLIHADIAIAWSADGTNAQITVPVQDVSGHYLTEAGSQVDFTLENLAADTITVSDNGANYPATLDLKFASIIDSLESVGSVSLLEAGNYHVAVSLGDLPLADNAGNAVTSINSAVEITNDMSVQGVTPTSENAFQINSAQVVLNDFDPATQADIHRVVSLDSAGGAITVDGSTSLNLTNLLNAANNSGDFETPTVSFELAKVPTGTGSGTIGIDILDGSDATRTEGSERLIHADIAIAWSADGTNAQITVPVQDVSGHYLTEAGSRVDFTLENLAADTITVSDNGANYPATLDLKFASIIDSLESVGSVSLLEAGNYHVAVSLTGLPLYDNAGNAVTSINSAVEITNDMSVEVSATGTTIEATTVSGTATHTDVDANNADNTFTAITTATASTKGYGTYTVTEGGAWTYSLDNTNATINALGAGQSASDTITVTAADGTTKDITITITGTNDAAVIAGTTTGAVTEDSTTTTASGQLTHTDVDANNDANVFATVTAGTASTGGYGTYEVTAAGAWTYTLDNSNATVTALAANATLDDTFTVTAEDGTEQLVTVTITGVNDKPVITSSATVSVPENGTGVMTVTTTDAESDTITYSISGTDAALFTIDQNSGVLTFMAAPDYEGEAPAHGSPHSNNYAITVTADDGTDTVDQALAITVTNVEGGPVFSSSATPSVDENQTSVVTLAANDDENDNIAFSITGGTDAASFDLTDGVLTFKNAPDFETQSSYTLTVTASETTDQDGGSIATPNTTDQEITVTLNDINDAAVITAADASLAEGTATVSDTATHTDVDANNDANVFTAVTDVAATYGTYSVTSAGVWTYTLDNTNATIDALGAGQSTTDTITVTAEDGTTKDITITITGTNDAAVITGTTTGAVTEDSSTTTASGQLTHTDVDANNDANVFATVTAGTASTGGYGTYEVTAAGAWTYTLDNSNATVTALAANATLDDTFTVTAEDGTEQLVTVTITGVNDKPVATADSVTISEDAVATVIAVLGNDTDAEDDATGTALTVNGKTSASNGTVTLADGVISYKPNADFNGTDSFSYTVIDSGSAVSETATVTVTVSAVNDDPTGAVTISGSPKTGQTLTAVTDTLADVDGLGTLSYQWAKDGTDVTGATGSTLVLGDADIGSTFTVTASYTDGDGTAESVSSSATAAVTDIVKLIQVRDAATLTAAQASTEINGQDYTSGSTDSVLKFDLWLDAEGIDSLNASATEILGAEFSFAWDANQLDDVSAFASEENETWLMDFAVEPNIFTVSASNNADGSVSFGKETAVVDTDTDNDGDRNPIPLELKVGTVYLNPKDGVTDLQLTVQGMTISTDDSDVTPLNYVVDVL